MGIKTTSYLSNLRHKLTFKFFLTVILCSTVFAGLSVALQVFLSYRAETKRIENNVKFIEKSYLPSIADSFFNLDEPLLRRLLLGALQLQGVQYCEVSEKRNGKIYRIFEGNPNSRKDIVREFPLQYQTRKGEPFDIGMLTVFADFEGISTQLWAQATLNILISTIQIFTTAFIVLIIFQIMVSRHLSAMAGYAQELSIDNLEPGLKLNRRSVKDELSLVADEINDLRERLRQDIAKRERQEEELRFSHDRFRIVMDSLDAAVYVADMETYELLFINKFIRDHWGDISGKTCWKVLQLNQTGPCQFCNNEKLVDDNGEPTDVCVWEFQNKTDNQWYECRDQAIRWTDGRIVRMQIATNITERKRDEEALRNSERRLSDIISFLPDATFVIDTEGKVVAWNRAIEELTGIKAEDMIGKGDYEYAIPFYGYRRPVLIDLVTHRDEEIAKTYEYIKKKGDILVSETKNPPFVPEPSLFWNTARPLYNTHGEIIGAIEVIRDITDRMLAEEALRKSEEKYRNLFENLYDVYYRTNDKGIITHLTPSIKKYSGYTPDELIGKDIKNYYVDPQCRERFLSRLFKDGYVDNYEAQLKRKDNSKIWVSTNAKLLKDDDGNFIGVEGISRDVTDRKELEYQLVQTQKMESIGTLAGGIAHDFNNILSSVFGYTELALDDAKEGTLQHEHLQEVLRAGNRAKNLVKQILTFSRQVDQEQKPIQVKPIIKEALKLLRAFIPSTVEIKQRIQSNELVMGDSTKIHQVLMNLCTNAAHAMDDEGGVLTVSLTDVEFDSEFLNHHEDLKPGPYINLTVTDTGHGMPPDIMKKIFDPFFTTKEKGEGTGMGLSVVHGIVRSHGGDIYVYSEPGKGSTFQVYLPVIERRLEVEERAARIIPTGTERILFVDDEPAIAKVGAQILESLGYDVVTRTSSIDALELFKAQNGRFDLVITDMTMPHMTGEKLAKELMQARSDIPVILCTGFSSRINEHKALGIGIRTFISKPILKREIAEAVRRVLDEKQ